MSPPMPKSPPDGGRAFPATGPGTHGMTYRQWMVGQALAGGELGVGSDRQRASRAVFIADQCIELLGMDKEKLEHCQEILR